MPRQPPRVARSAVLGTRLDVPTGLVHVASPAAVVLLAGAEVVTRETGHAQSEINLSPRRATVGNQTKMPITMAKWTFP